MRSSDSRPHCALCTSVRPSVCLSHLRVGRHRIAACGGVGESKVTGSQFLHEDMLRLSELAFGRPF